MHDDEGFIDTVSQLLKIKKDSKALSYVYLNEIIL